jgi:hypothetical protein
MYDLAEQAGSSELVQAGVTGCTKKSVEKKSEASRASSTRITRWLRTAGHPVRCVRLPTRLQRIKSGNASSGAQVTAAECDG